MNTLNKNANGYNYRYTDLAEIHNYLASEGLSYYQEVEVSDGNDYIITVKLDKEGNEVNRVRGCRVVQATLKGNNNPAQEQGSALTYARRYSLLMAYGLCTTDDDAEMLSRRGKVSQEMAEAESTPISKSHAKILKEKASKLGVDVASKYGKESIDDLTEAEYGRAINALTQMEG